MYSCAMTDRVHTASDIPKDHWIDRLAPAAARPYLRLARVDRPIGTWLLLFPCWWGLGLATPGWPDAWYAFLFAAGSLVMRAAGCTINDIADRDFDRRVARTALRPIASGQITVQQALVFLALLLAIGFAILTQFNLFTVALGASSLALVTAYPFMKRITYWPQAFLGLTFNWGILLGWAAVEGALSAPTVVLYAAAVFWTLGYDTIYAHQDKEDDLQVGIKSTALKFGERTRPWLFAFYAATVLLLGVGGYLAALAWPYYVALAAVALQLAWQAGRVNIADPSDCLVKFRSNRLVGWIVLAGIVAGQVAAL
jgi:4-hydroxybenzoate polyprenyltransferase